MSPAGLGSPHPMDPARSYRRGQRRRQWIRIGGPVLLTCFVVASVLAYGWYTRQPASGNGLGGGQGTFTDPNPQQDRVLSVSASLEFTGNSSGYLAILDPTHLCPQCPFVVPADLRFSPPMAGFVFFLNVSNSDVFYHMVSSFRVTTTSSSAQQPFDVQGVFCCYPGYGEASEGFGIVPGQSLGIMVEIDAASLAGPVQTDYAVQFYLTSSE